MAITRRALRVAERRAFVLQLRKAGLSYRKIAEAVRQQFPPEELPKNYDERRAHEDVRRELKKLKALAEDVRQLELERLDEMLVAIWPQAQNGQFEAIDRVLKIMRHRAQLIGSRYDEESGELVPVQLIEVVRPNEPMGEEREKAEPSSSSGAD